MNDQQQTDLQTTVGRVCRWYDTAGELVMVTLDAWSPASELEVIEVAYIGPFDDGEAIAEEMLGRLTAQGRLW